MLFCTSAVTAESGEREFTLKAELEEPCRMLKWKMPARAHSKLANLLFTPATSTVV